MIKSSRSYNQIGHVVFPIHDPSYENLFETAPEHAGILSVRLLVEDQTTDQSWPITPGPATTAEDFLVYCDRFVEVREAHEYFQTSRKIVDNILLGITDWSGAQRLDNRNVSIFGCGKIHLDEQATRLYSNFEDRYVGCKLYLMTSLNRKRETIESLVREAEAFRLQVKQVPKVLVEPILCEECFKKNEMVVKPLVGAKRLGWRKIGRKGRRWVCPIHTPQDVVLH